MPILNDYLHYRIFDLSSFEMMVQVKLPMHILSDKKKLERADERVWQTIHEMKYYYGALKE
jgi:oligoribonuclease (3'-5' exoribonuclease)